MNIVLCFAVLAAWTTSGESATQEIVTELLSDADLLRELNGHENETTDVEADTNNTDEDGSKVQTVLPSESYDFDVFLDKIGFPGVRHQPGADDEDDRRRHRSRRYAKMVDLHSAKVRNRPEHYEHPKPVKDRVLPQSTTTRKPTIMPEHMNPGVIFRVRMSDAILRIKQRLFDDLEVRIESDIIYVNLIKKVVADEIVKYSNFLLVYKTDKSAKEHVGECGGRIYKFITLTTVKVNIFCLFDSLWIDGIPYVIGDDYSVSPLEMPPQLQCDASECSTITYVDSFGGPANLEE